MKIIHLFQFKNSIFHKIPFFKEEHRLKNDLTEFGLMNIEIVTEYVVKIHDDFIFEKTSKDDLLQACKKAQKIIEHYFVTGINDYGNIRNHLFRD
ncbi:MULTISPECIES: heme oxygenase [Chryseobacterium]|uniref:Heme oxygenase n=1 Tax=Chryseobacterium viscerum TaxID=1037377 RepID=A0A316WHJ3_9FLAO|nr:MULTISPECIES: heme oxygenase [Chryseobacterium]PWN60892.1 heme oxygenase [Chryseobacterium viscerum]UKB81493.1 heme oxygenase [Chryseobacterium sp. MEBOG07]